MAAVAETVAAVEAAVAPVEGELHDGRNSEEKSTPVEEVAAPADEEEKLNASAAEAKVEVETEAASPSATPVKAAQAPASVVTAPVLHVAQYPSSDESDSDSDFQE